MESRVLLEGVTVGICAYNEGKNIGQLLDSVLTEQQLPAESEVLVVCSGCTDSTVAIVNDYSKKDHRIHAFIENERKRKASAMNHILSRSKYGSILFISADTLPAKRCFSGLLERLQDENVGIVCGRPVPINTTNSLVGRIVQLLWGFHNRTFQDLNDGGLARHATEVFCIRKGIVDTIPPETVNDDAYVALMAKKKGWLIKYETGSRISICGPKTFSDYLKQRRRVLYGHRQVKKITGESPQHLIYLLPLYPVRVIELLKWAFREYGFLDFFVFVTIEIGISIIALIDSFSGKVHTIWGVSASTKRVAGG